VEVTGVSIAAHMARLWKGSVGGTILRQGVQKPWDIVPVIGMCQRLGFVFVEINDQDWTLRPFTPEVSKQEIRWPHEVLIVHQSRLPEVTDWLLDNS